MPTFYFDINDGDHQINDDVGTMREFRAIVRDAAGTPIFRATLSLVAEWIDER